VRLLQLVLNLTVTVIIFVMMKIKIIIIFKTHYLHLDCFKIAASIKINVIGFIINQKFIIKCNHCIDCLKHFLSSSSFNSIKIISFVIVIIVKV